jgi:cardiolipin synthase
MLPNILSIIRILFIPVYLYFFFKGNFLLAAIFFSFSAITDFLDGYFARKYNLTTKLGRILDPLADKLTVISILTALIYANLIPRFIIIILLIREIFIFISSGITFLMGYDLINPSNIGKISIFLLYIAIAIELLQLDKIAMLLFYIVIPLNIYSGINYVLTTIRILREKP